MRLKPIGQQVVVVMGASSGIGRETALRFAAKGARVVVSARGEEGLTSLVEEIRAAGGEAIAVRADVADLGQVRAVADAAVAQYGRLDTWIHMAAVALWATFEETTPEEFEQVLRINLLGQAHGAWAALPHLRQAGGGALIHVTSVEARRALPYHSAYAASKHGTAAFLEALRLELRHAGLPIAVTEVLPATINTPLFNQARSKVGFKPMGLPPLYPPALVADAILHVAQHPTREVVVGSSGQTMVTGQRLSPRMMDALFERIGFRGQLTDEPKPADAPDNLFAPMPGDHRVDGDFKKQAAVVGGPALLSQNNGWLVAGAALGVLALLATRPGRNGR